MPFMPLAKETNVKWTVLGFCSKLTKETFVCKSKIDNVLKMTKK